MAENRIHASLTPSPWVTRWASQLRAGAAVLDLACGAGRHVRWMAARGLAVTAVDRNEEAIANLRGLNDVEVLVADIENQPWPLAQRRFDAIVITNYLWRPLWPQLIESLGPQGMLIYETFSVDNASVGKPSNPDFLLRHGELLERCVGLRVLGYEDGFLANPDRFTQRIAAVRIDDEASLSAQPVRFAL